MEPASRTINRKRTGGGTASVLSYPKDIGNASTVIIFKSYDFDHNKNLVSGSTQNVGADGIVLPLPKTMQDTQSIRTQPRELGVTGALLADAMSSTMNQTLSSKLRDLAGNLASMSENENLVTDSSNAILYFQRSALDKISSGAGAAFGITSGKAVNPHAVINFEGIDMKSHTFTWSLSPKNESESKTIAAIIKKIKSKALPAYEGVTGGTELGVTGGSLSRALLKYPDLAYVYFTGINQERWYYLKPCMISQISIDYTPHGVSVLEGGNPTSMELTITMIETEIHTRADYEGGEDGGMLTSNITDAIAEDELRAREAAEEAARIAERLSAIANGVTTGF